MKAHELFLWDFYFMKSSELYDLIIIGAGPAGTAAGVYAARKKLKTLLLTEDVYAVNPSPASGGGS